MSTEKQILKVRRPVQNPLSLAELSELLARHYKLTDGKYELMVEFRIGLGNMGPTEEEKLPGAMIGVHRIGLVEVEHDGPFTIDAATIKYSESSAE